MTDAVSTSTTNLLWLADRDRWVSQAQALIPTLHETVVPPVTRIDIVPDASALHGWKSTPNDATLQSLPDTALGKGDSVTLDFGVHLVGHLRFRIRSDRWFNDSPVRLRLIFGETLAELAEPFDPYPGELSRAWLQDVQVDVDELPANIHLSRRYAFRYVRVDIVDTSPQFKVQITDIECVSITSAGPDLGRPPTSADLAAIDAVSLRTLANCMQTVFEDGPKRDRRLWLGDLRLQALTNYVSFKNYDLVKRCLLLHAGLARTEDGVVPACIFERPEPAMGHAFILDYTALFGPTLLDYVTASGDIALGEELWPVAATQIDTCLRYVDGTDWLFHDPGNWWLFVDWRADLHKEASVHAIIVYALRRTAELARLIGRPAESVDLDTTAESMSVAARRQLRSDDGLYVSGLDRQVSWATQAWMILAGIPESQADASGLFDALAATPNAVPPAGPYLWHYVVEALLACGRTKQALDLLRSYWGAMVDRGATTFWEVFDPANEYLSPYNSHLINSYCHAWSCTPAYFLRRHHVDGASP